MAPCEEAQGTSFVCGADHPEDLALVPETRWLVASGFNAGSGIKLVDTRARTLRRWYTGREFYVVAFGWHAVVAFSHSNPTRLLRKAIAPGFMPDNIHWDGDRLIAAGMQYDEPACGGLRKVIDGKADPMLCHRGYTVAHLDTRSMTWSIAAYAEPNPSFNGASTGLILGDELWVGSFQSDRIAIRKLPGALSANP